MVSECFAQAVNSLDGSGRLAACVWRFMQEASDLMPVFLMILDVDRKKKRVLAHAGQNSNLGEIHEYRNVIEPLCIPCEIVEFLA